MKRVAALISGRGSNLQALLEAEQDAYEIALVVSNVPGAAGLERAREARVEAIALDHKPYGKNREAFERDLDALLIARNIELVALAGFMRVLTPFFVNAWKNRLLNIHPSLLPSFPGPSAYRQAYEHGVKIVGVTAHFVSMHLDEGPIISQDSFPLRAGMSLKEIIATGQQLEAKTLVKAIKLYLTKRLDVYWGTVREV